MTQSTKAEPCSQLSRFPSAFSSYRLFDVCRVCTRTRYFGEIGDPALGRALRISLEQPCSREASQAPILANSQIISPNISNFSSAVVSHYRCTLVCLHADSVSVAKANTKKQRKRKNVAERQHHYDRRLSKINICKMKN